VHKKFGIVPTCVTRVTDQIGRSFPSSEGSSKSPVYAVGGNMCVKNQEQRIDIKFFVKIAIPLNTGLRLLRYEQI
jgi:hypothetical protein